ncbi:hypothetical protein [Haloplanus halobius]|uniref:hypothetical protein n=1 Tax=Haloplanus halobius TaxID=2934938 RepID=UPI00200FE72A|nr:hypothetical protein [Haloplanus sp. XH21]
MARDLTLRNFLRDLRLRLGAAAVVVGIFFGLGYLNRIDFLGGVLDSQAAFFGAAFLLIGIVSLVWIGIQRRRAR